MGGSVGGGVGGCVGANVVGKGVGGTVGEVFGRAVVGRVVHPRPAEMQHQSCFSLDHKVAQLAKPSLQSKGRDVVEIPDKSQYKKGSKSSRLRRQQPVMMQVKSRLGRTTSKSPPRPMYL